METKGTHHLSVIMFCDIAGYTALMQNNEVQALGKLQLFKSVLEKYSMDFGGKIIHFYGDGCLLVFESTFKALECGIALQNSFLNGGVPVRIGLHIGEVLEKDENIFGDSVNITSRIESMGIPGAILLSQTIRDQIKNHPEFEVKSLGRWTFKNVSVPMQVFALVNTGLAIPNPRTLKGKLKRGGRWKRQWMLPALMLLAGILGVFIWQFQVDRSTNLLEFTQEERVAISVFENRTSKEDLDPLGFMLSEWAAKGLQEIGVKVVSPEMIRSFNESIGILPDNSLGKTSFAELTGARYVITGSYYLEEGSIRLQARISNTLTGMNEQSFPVLMCPAEQQSQLVDQFNAQLLGFWSSKPEIQQNKIRVPDYEAYKYYLLARQVRQGQGSSEELELLEKALAKDSTLIVAKLQLFINAIWSGQEERTKRLADYLRRHQMEMTQYERNLFHYYQNFWHKNFKAAFDHIQRNYAFYPQDILINHEVSYFAVAQIQKPQFALDTYSKIPIDHYQSEQFFGVLRSRYYHEQYAQLWLQDYESIIRTGYEPIKEMMSPFIGILSYLFLAYVAQGDLVKFKAFITNFESQEFHLLADPARKLAFYQSVLYALHFYGYNNEMEPYMLKVEEAIAALEPLSSLVSVGKSYEIEQLISYYDITAQWEKARPILEELYLKSAARERTMAIFYLGVIAAKTGEEKVVLKRIRGLALQETNMPNAVYNRGLTDYYRGVLYALLGEKELAVNHLKTAIQKGKQFDRYFFLFDSNLSVLKDYVPFQELVQPKG